MADQTPLTEPTPSTAPAAGTNPILLRAPRKYCFPAPDFVTPPLTWLERTWTVTHSTLPMWRKAKNVRITYKLLPSPTPETTQLDDEVTSEPTAKTWMPQPKSIRGIDSPDGLGAWKWRGTGMLKLVTSKWEVLGWGESEEVEGEEECWVVTWFEASLFTPAGVDIYCSRKGGVSSGLFERIQDALGNVGIKEVEDLCRVEMRGVEIDG